MHAHGHAHTHIHTRTPCFIIKQVNTICITVLSLVRDWAFNSVEGIVITIYCVPIGGNDIITFCRTCYIIYSRQH